MFQRVWHLSPKALCWRCNLSGLTSTRLRGRQSIGLLLDPLDDGWRKTGEIKFSAQAPFMVGKTADLDCADRAAGASVYVSSGEYPIPATGGITPPPDTQLKRTPVFVKACLATTDTQEPEPQLEMHPVEARRELGITGFVPQAGDRVR